MSRFSGYTFGMLAQRTIPIIIENDIDVATTVAEFGQYQRQISPLCFNKGKPLGAISLHKAVYHTANTSLPSQLRCTAIRLVAGAYASARSNKHSVRSPFKFRRDRSLFLIGKRGRDASFRKDGLLSISTVYGRRRVSYDIPHHFIQDFSEAVSIDALSIQKNGKASLCLTLKFPDPDGVAPVGIDLGISNAIVASTTDDTLVIDGRQNGIRNKRTRKTRSRLQKKLSERKVQGKDTRSIRRALKRLSQKHSNRNRSFCKESAAKLVEWAPKDAILILEDLNIKRKSKTEPFRKGVRRKLNQWFYRRIIQAIKNRAERSGIALTFVDPAYTSQICNQCGLIGNRTGSKFSCPYCGHFDHADRNASLNILSRFTVLRSSGPQSIGPEALRSCKGKPSTSVGGS